MHPSDPSISFPKCTAHTYPHFPTRLTARINQRTGHRQLTGIFDISKHKCKCSLYSRAQFLSFTPSRTKAIKSKNNLLGHGGTSCQVPPNPNYLLLLGKIRCCSGRVQVRLRPAAASLAARAGSGWRYQTQTTVPCAFSSPSYSRGTHNPRKVATESDMYIA